MPTYSVTQPTKIFGKPAKVGDQFELEEGDAQSYLDDGVIEGPVEAPAGDNTTVTTVKPGATASKPRAPAARKK